MCFCVWVFSRILSMTDLTIGLRSISISKSENRFKISRLTEAQQNETDEWKEKMFPFRLTGKSFVRAIRNVRTIEAEKFDAAMFGHHRNYRREFGHRWSLIAQDHVNVDELVPYRQTFLVDVFRSIMRYFPRRNELTNQVEFVQTK